MKTPEELAEEYLRYESESHYWAKQSFLAGYKAAQEHAHAALEEAEINADKAYHQGLKDGAPQWISVKDRLPEDASDVLIAWADGVSEACFCDETWCREGRRLLWVTHWMPLPDGPKEEK